MKQNTLSRAVSRALYGAAAVATGLPAAALAQEGDLDALEEIVVTGSRIATDANLVTSSPVTTLDADEILHRGITRVEDLVNSLPQVTPEFTSTVSNGATGTATLDLRGLGSKRTLVLTNGHRMGFGNPFELAVDVNQIPTQLIDRVELLTGGASSVYGADAVAGVVNFITKRDFEGFQIDWQQSGYQHDNSNGFVRSAVDAAGFEQAPGDVTDGQTTSINLLIGVNSPDGRGNVTGYLGYREIDPILQSSRDYSSCTLDTGSSNGTTCAGSATIPTGLFSPFDGATYFTVAGDEFVPWDYTYYNYGPLNHFQRPDERTTAGLFGHYEISESFVGYAELMFMDDQSLAQIAPSGAFFVTDSINCSNAFLSAQQFATLGCTDPSDVIPWYIGRRNVEGGPRFDDLRHTSNRALVGIRGDINTAWSYDVSANFSRTRYSQVYNNDLSITAIGRSLDAIVDPDDPSNIVCRSAVPDPVTGAVVDAGCIPWNIFQTGGVTDAAINYLSLPLFAKADLEQDQYVAFVNVDLGEYGVALPSATDGFQGVLGYEFRDESLSFEPDTGFTSGDGAGQGGPIPGILGGLDVNELFLEVKAPLIQDKPGFQSLALDLRYRYSDYSTGIDTDTWNIGGEWRPIDSLMFRGGISRAVRAPNLRELFEPRNIGLWSGSDPCTGATPEFTEEQCARTGVTAAQYRSVPANPAGQYNESAAGDTTLLPEESDSFTIGLVYTPTEFLPGLSLTIDYWSIEVTDAIQEGFGSEFTIRQCGETGEARFCDKISRGPNGNLWIGQANVDATTVNIGFFETAGIDVSAAYATDIGRYGVLDFAIRSTILETFDQQPLEGFPIEDCAGVWGGSCQRARPDYKHVFNANWATPWDLNVALTWRYVGEVDEFQQDRFTASAQNYFDLSGNYVFEWAGGETLFNVGISNVLDREPPVSGLFGNVEDFGNGNTLPGTWDALGRYWFAGVTHTF
ncbi:MAG: TonB-dependent receptor [Pseudomonadota bacterium]